MWSSPASRSTPFAIPCLDPEPETVRARIARARVGEMIARGWRAVGPAEEGCVLMEGPDPDGGPEPLGAYAVPLASAAWERAVARLEERFAHAA